MSIQQEDDTNIFQILISIITSVIRRVKCSAKSEIQHSLPALLF